MSDRGEARKRWMAFYVVCLGALMIVLDTTIVNVALPSIRTDLKFDESSLAWVVNAYMLTFGGFLLLGGRLGDFFGHRRLFLNGLAFFTVASLACGLSVTKEMLIVARGIQGLGGAVVSAVALSLSANLFPDPAERTKAMGVYGFVCAGGGCLGVVLGGLLTNAFTWHSIFLVNIPVGVAVFALTRKLLPAAQGPASEGRVDVAGAVTITGSLILAVYAIVNGNGVGWVTVQTMGLLALSAALMGIFLWIEGTVRSPLMPLSLFRSPNVAVVNVVGVLWAASMFTMFFLSALYLQLVLEYTPLLVGLSFLPSNMIMAAFSLGLSAKLVTRFGIRVPLTVGLMLAAAGLGLFAFAPVDGSFIVHVLPSMVLLGVGSGAAFNPLLIAAMSSVAPSEAGLASGAVNTSFMMGGALGLAILASLAAFRTEGLLSAGTEPISALNGGYHAAFIAGTGFAVLAALLGATLIREHSAAS